MKAAFGVSKINGPKVAAYWVESGAPINVDDPIESAIESALQTQAAYSHLPRGAGWTLSDLSPRGAVDEIAGLLCQARERGQEAQLVITIHGFNNPQDVVIRRYISSFTFMSGDTPLSNNDGLVCIGYRWPSEEMFAPWNTSVRAAPSVLSGLAIVGGLFALLAALLKRPPNFLHALLSPPRHIVSAAAIFFGGIPLIAALLRTVVYFRDTYRAANYGTPDLVEFLRHLNHAIFLRRPHDPNFVKLSFIGHSMGAFVVTNTVRILSDVFDPNSLGELEGDAADPQPKEPTKEPPPDIGDAFSLGRLILVSPDIPSEALMMRRSNFLAASLRRFQEVHLFSNEGDVVLRFIATLANYFSFPTTSRAHGFRLGNIEVLGEDPKRVTDDDYGIINRDRYTTEPDDKHLGEFLTRLRVGERTLMELHGSVLNQVSVDTAPLPTCVSYFDCTDYRDTPAQQPGAASRPLLSFGLRKPKLSPCDTYYLLFNYLGLGKYLSLGKSGHVDVHSGYFDGDLSQKLIYRLACLGFGPTVASFGTLSDLHETCKNHRLQVLLSPKLSGK